MAYFSRIKIPNGLNGYGSVLRFYSNALKLGPSKSLMWHLLKDTKIYLRVLYLARRATTCITSGSWGEALYFRDTEGRLLGENTAVLNHPSITWKERTFSDRRGQVKINEPALKSIAGSWDQLLADVAGLRAAYMRRFKIQSHLNYADLFYLARIGTSIPCFLARLNENSLSPFQVPVRWANVFKVLAGVHGIVVTMIAQRALDKQKLLQVPISDDMFDFGNEHNLFVTPTGQACAGSKTMILQLLDVMIHGQPVETITKATNSTGFSDQMLDYGVYNAKIDLLLLWRDVIHYFIRNKRCLGPGANTPTYKDICQILQCVCEALKVLVYYCEPKERFEIDPEIFWNFDGSDGAWSHDMGAKRTSEEIKVFEHFMSQVNVCLGKNRDVKVARTEINQRYCGYFTEQVFACSPQVKR